MFEVTRMTAVKVAVMCALLFVAFFCGAMLTVPTAVEKGRKEGYLQALTDVADKTGITFEWEDLGNGNYQIYAYYEGTLVAKGSSEIHVYVEHWRNGELLSYDHHAGVLTTIGKNWIEGQISDNVQAEEYAEYISCSNDAGSPAAGWTQLPNEINANGLARAIGTYASTGDGTWNVSKTFSVTGTQSVQLYGLQWTVTPVSDNNLLCADTSAQKNCVSGDTLKVTWQCTVT